MSDGKKTLHKRLCPYRQNVSNAVALTFTYLFSFSHSLRLYPSCSFSRPVLLEFAVAKKEKFEQTKLSHQKPNNRMRNVTEMGYVISLCSLTLFRSRFTFALYDCSSFVPVASVLCNILIQTQNSIGISTTTSDNTLAIKGHAISCILSFTSVGAAVVAVGVFLHSLICLQKASR